ncbi:hypothetical protein HAX54_031364, partial [Datura stramonium]|nr:hypothetical protein [Datura stramonium]
DKGGHSKRPILTFMGFEFFLLWQVEVRQRKSLEKGILKKRKRKDVGDEFLLSRGSSRKAEKKPLKRKPPLQKVLTWGIEASRQGMFLGKDRSARE